VTRSSFILGVALLVVAATLAATITMRNAPREAGEIDEAGQGGRIVATGRAYPADYSASFDRRANHNLAGSGGRPQRVRFDVTVPASELAVLPAGEQALLRQRAAEVESGARERLETLTEELALTREQRAKMFPLLARSMPGYDAVMQVGGVWVDVDRTTLPDEEVHALLDAEQQARFEDAELDRQLWWQDIFNRLEAELLDDTGGGSDADAPVPTEPVEPVPAEGGGRTAPAPRGGGNLLNPGN